jgi:hypothetical protein
MTWYSNQRQLDLLRGEANNQSQGSKLKCVSKYVSKYVSYIGDLHFFASLQKSDIFTSIH